LSAQLRTISAVTSLLVEANVKSLGPVIRPPIIAEAGAPAEDSAEKKGKKNAPSDPELEIAPFDVSFNADQTGFRLALNRVLELKPPVFLRLLSVENSSPSPPAKSPDADATVEEPAASGAIRPVVGRETVNVSMKMASVVPSPSSSP